MSERDALPHAWQNVNVGHGDNSVDAEFLRTVL